MADSWCKNLEKVPSITQTMIEKWANDTVRIPRAKQIEGYTYFIDGYIHDVEGKL